jgi:predicted RNA methylase
MRLAAAAKAGFYPASPVAIEGILKHIHLADKEKEHSILDPCCGEGHAICQLAEGLGVKPSEVYAVELDLGRTKVARETLPEGNVLGPASFMGTQISGYSFSLAYVNPPFDFELGGNRREEQTFVMRSTHLLAAKGVLVLVMPIDKIMGNRQFVEYLDCYFEDLQMYRLPDGHRPYKEVVVFGRKRKIELPRDSMERFGVFHQRGWQWNYYMKAEDIPALGDVQPKSWRGSTPSWDREDAVQTWAIERGWKPGTFKKIAFTDEELIEVVGNSPLGRHLLEVEPRPIPRPPLPLDRGHLGLILASGILDGVVESKYGPHVVRGSSTKVEYYNREASDSTEDPDTGAVTTKDVYSQRMVTIIRCVTADGTIHTFSNAPKEDGDENK